MSPLETTSTSLKLGEQWEVAFYCLNIAHCHLHSLWQNMAKLLINALSKGSWTHNDFSGHQRTIDWKLMVNNLMDISISSNSALVEAPLTPKECHCWRGYCHFILMPVIYIKSCPNIKWPLKLTMRERGTFCDNFWMPEWFSLPNCMRMMDVLNIGLQWLHK